MNVAWECGGIQNGDYLAAFTQLLLPIAYEVRGGVMVLGGKQLACAQRVQGEGEVGGRISLAA